MFKHMFKQWPTYILFLVLTKDVETVKNNLCKDAEFWAKYSISSS